MESQSFEEQLRAGFIERPVQPWSLQFPFISRPLLSWISGTVVPFVFIAVSVETEQMGACTFEVRFGASQALHFVMKGELKLFTLSGDVGKFVFSRKE